MTDEERQLIRRCYLSADDLAYVASLPENEQARIDAELGKTLGAAQIRARLALVNFGREIVRAFPHWLQRLMRMEGEA